MLGVRVPDAAVVDLVDRLDDADLEVTAATLRSALDESAHHVRLDAHDREAILYVLEEPTREGFDRRATALDTASGLARLCEVLRSAVAWDRQRGRSKG